MIIANRSIHIIDYENNRILSRDIPAIFDEYVGELIEHITGMTQFVTIKPVLAIQK